MAQSWLTRLIGKFTGEHGHKIIGRGLHTVKGLIGKIESAHKHIEESLPEPVREAVGLAIEAAPYGHAVKSVYKKARLLAKLAGADGGGGGDTSTPAFAKKRGSKRAATSQLEGHTTKKRKGYTEPGDRSLFKAKRKR